MSMIKLVIGRAVLKPKGLPNRPPSLKAVMNARMRHILFRRPRSEPFRLSVVRQVAVAAGVIGLLLCVSPPAVAGLVVAVVVREPVDAHSDRALTHVSKKVAEVLPPVADGNPPSSVARVFVIGRALASGSHMAPDVVRPCVGHSMRDRLSRKDVCFVAPAGFGVATYQSAGVVDKWWHFVISEITHHDGARHPVMRPEFGSYPSRARGTIA